MLTGTEVGLARFADDRARDRYLAAYDAALDLWPVPHRSELIETRFGPTHAVVSGSVSGSGGERPLLLLPAAMGAGAVQWYPNIAALSADREVYALDFVGAPGLGNQTAPILNRADCAQWLVDVIDRLGADQVDVVGSSQGAWFALNLAVQAPDRVHRVAALGPAASLLPFRLPVLLMLRLGSRLPARSAPYTLQASFGDRYRPDRRLVDLVTAGMRFRYQDRAVFPSVFGDDELNAIGPKAMVLVGDKEAIYDPAEAVTRAQRVMEGARVELVGGVGHLLNLEAPDLVNDRVLAFLYGNGASSEDGVDPASSTTDVAGVAGPGLSARARGSVARSVSIGRRLSMGVLRAARSAAPMHGLIEIDVTEMLAKREAVRASGEPVPSMTALVVATVARLAARHPEVHRHLDWRGRMVEHRHVDVNTLVEIEVRGGRFPLATVVHDADIRSVADITAQLDRTKADSSALPDVNLLNRVPDWVGRLPGLIPGLYWFLGRTARGRARIGTVSVSAVGMFGRGGGFGIAPASVYSLMVVVGGVEDRPRVVDGEVVVRRMLDLTVSFDHNLIDGGPAARFVAELREALSTGHALDETSG